MRKNNWNDWNDFEIIEQELVDWEKTENRWGSSGHYDWEGKLKTDEGIFKFKYNRSWIPDNGGEGAEIVSKKPKNMTKKEWEEYEQELIDFLETQEWDDEDE
jgi:hypothetical protein